MPQNSSSPVCPSRSVLRMDRYMRTAAARNRAVRGSHGKWTKYRYPPL